MSSKDIERGEYLRRLFEKQLNKSDPKGSHDARHREAEDRMDRKLGKEWRDEIGQAEIEFVQVESKGPCADVPGFYSRVAKLGDEEGLGNKVDAPEDGERPEAENKEHIMKQIGKLLRQLL